MNTPDLTERPKSPSPVACSDLLESLAVRLERRAREMDKAHAFNDEEKTQRRCMVVIYMEISNMLRAECEKLPNKPPNKNHT